MLAMSCPMPMFPERWCLYLEVFQAERARTTWRRLPARCPRFPPAAQTSPSVRRSLSEAIGRLHSGCSEGRALVFDNGRLAGIVSARDGMRTLQWAGLSSARAALHTSCSRHDVTPAGAGRTCAGGRTRRAGAPAT